MKLLDQAVVGRLRAPGSAIAPVPAPRVSGERVLFVDAGRSVVIFGALLLHVLNVFGLWEGLHAGTFKAVGNGCFRACTPTFFLLFGVLLEWVAVPRVQRGQGASASWGLLRRACWCLVGLQAGLFCAWVVGRMDNDSARAAAIGLADVPLSSVLRFYTLALPLCIPVILLRARLGIMVPAVLIGVIWAGAAWMSSSSWPWAWPDQHAHYAFLCAFLVGHPPLWVAGSVWHDLSLVFFGMLLGYYMRLRMHAGQRPLGGWGLIAVVGAGIMGIAYYLHSMGVDALAQGYFGTAMRLRAECHPAYFIISTLSALALLWLMQLWFPPAAPKRPAPAFFCLGRYSLLAFALGNAGLNLLPRNDARPLWQALLGACLFLVGWYMLIWLIDRWGSARRRARAGLAPGSLG